MSQLTEIESHFFLSQVFESMVYRKKKTLYLNISSGFVVLKKCISYRVAPKSSDNCKHTILTVTTTS